MNGGTRAAAAERGDPAQCLQGVVLLRRMADRMERAHVDAARSEGWTWQQIGDALGVSRQAVHKKYGR